MVEDTIYRQFIINPGSTSTKFAVYDNERCILNKTVEHHGEELKEFPKVADQYEYRLSILLQILKEEGISPESFSAVVGRGGLLRPMAGGTYEVNDLMKQDLIHAVRGEHASNLGGLIADDFGKRYGIPAFIVDPVAVDEMDHVARLSGLPDIERNCLSHALNMKAVARKVVAKFGKPYEACNLIVAHLGSGISVAPHKKGRMIDVNGAMEEGPFSPERCAGLPATQLMTLCYSGKYTQKEIADKLHRQGGMYAYLGTKDVREAEKRATEGDKLAEQVLEAMAYQVAKEIGAMSAVLEGDIDCIILTGGIAYSEFITERITRRVKFLAPIEIVPGEEELESLALGGLRVLRSEEKAKSYGE